MTRAATRSSVVRPAAPTGLPRLLAGYRAGATLGLPDHLARYGRPPRPPGPGRRGEGPIGWVEAAGLRGRGGAGFPTARKMRAVTEQRGRPVVVANGAEGEALSAKDRLLLASLPHLVLDGATIAASAVGADEVVVAVDRSARRALSVVQRAIDVRRDARLDPVRWRLVETPSRYVAGEETALVNFVNGGPAKPTFVPPRPFQRGVSGRPTLMQNVETFAHLALIARYGAEWFRAMGTAEEPGSVLLTVNGAVAHASVCEVALGTPIGAAIDAVGGPTEEIAAFLVGGYYGTWIPARTAWDLPLTNAALRTVGGALGTGVLYAFPAGRCGLIATSRIAAYLAGETAGQCGPCVYGLRAVADAMASVAAGHHTAAIVDRLHQLFDQIRGRGACHYPDGVIRFVESALDVFSEELALHEMRQRCLTGAPPELPLPRSDGSFR